MRILIVGSDSNAYTLARNFSSDNNVDVVFVAPGNKYISEFAECVDISDTENEELLDFVVANEISLTVVTSLKAIENDIAGYFSDFRRNIFAPSFDAAYSTLYKSASKKTLYKLNIPTVRFGVFDRENQAVNYVSDSRIPLVIKSDSLTDEENPILVNSFSNAKRVVEKFFMQPDSKIIIEDYIDAKQVFLYFITDGYSALPFASCSYDNHSSSSVFSPDNAMSFSMVKQILNRVIYPYIDYCSSKNTPYCGVIGVDLLVEDDTYKVIELLPFFKELHLQSILPRFNQNISELLLSVAVGSFSDDYNRIDMNESNVYTKLSDSEFSYENVSQYDDDNFSFSYDINGKLILSQKGMTYSRSKDNLDCAIMYLKTLNNLTGEVSYEEVKL